MHAITKQFINLTSTTIYFCKPKLNYWHVSFMLQTGLYLFLAINRLKTQLSYLSRI